MKLIDTTLREGSQAPDVHFTHKEVGVIAQMLSDYQVDCIEVGHPYCNEYEFKKTSIVKSLGLATPILAHARATSVDIDAVKASEADWVGIFIGINDISLKNKYRGSSVSTILDKIGHAVSYAKNLGLRVRFTIEDTSRTSRDRQLAAFDLAIKMGADRICYSDTVGILGTQELRDEILHLRNHFPNQQLEIHLHNDRGLALANAVYVKDLVDWISCSVNGIGERCGITDTLALHENLVFTGDRIGSNIELGRHLSTIVNAFSRTNTTDRAPIVGKYAFTHCADLHQKAFKKDINSYCWLDNYPHQKASEKYIFEAAHFINELPPIISSEELKYHRKGPGNRYVLMDSRITRNARQYCIAREIDEYCDNYPSYVDSHVHHCDSLFIFLGDQPNFKGLKVEVQLDDQYFQLASPACVLIPSGKEHTYRVIEGKGTFINHVLSENYNESLLELPILKQLNMNGIIEETNTKS